MKSFVVITGQTATGKTSMAIKLAKKYDGEIVNADARQVYKKLDIITGKDLDELQKAGINYHMFDVVDPKKRYSSHEYVEGAAAAIQDIRGRRKTPIIVGGTYLYIKHLLYGFDVNVPPNEELRKDLEKKSLKELQDRLWLDRNGEPSGRPSDINDSDWNNPRRLIRRIEIQRSPVIANNAKQSYKIASSLAMTQILGLKHKDRESLEKAVDLRIKKRLEQGAIDEVKHLLSSGYAPGDPGLQTIGYKQIISFLNGEIPEDAAIADWKNKEVRYAKRQLTFMRQDPHIRWEDAAG